MRKICAAIFTCLLMLSICTGVMAADSSHLTTTNSVTFTINEYDALMEQRAEAELALCELGYTQAEIDASRTYSAEEAVLEKASLSVSELKNCGYTDEQIAILKAYDGRDLAEYPQIRAVSGSLSGSISSPSYSTQSITAVMNWNWTTAPIFYAYEDAIAVRWIGVKPDGNQIMLKLNTNSAYTYAQALYYKILNTTSFDHVEYLAATNTSPYEHVEYPMQRLNAAFDAFPKMGVVRVRVDVPDTVTADIAESSFIFVYAFTEQTIGYSLSYPAGISIEVGTGTTKAYYGAVTITSDGVISSF